MHPPSPQLLRALRSSITTTNTARICAGLSRPTFAPSPIPQLRRPNSDHARPTRMIPRSHAQRPADRDRGPESKEDTQTDFAALNVLGDIPAPTTAVDACLDNGFHLNNGLRVRGGSGVMMVGGEAFAWNPWKVSGGSKADMVNRKGQFEVEEEEAWGILGLVWPRPGSLLLSVRFWCWGNFLLINTLSCRSADPGYGRFRASSFPRDEKTD